MTDKNLSINKYLDKTKPCLKDMIDLQKSDTWKIQLTMKIHFCSSKDPDEECGMYSKSDINRSYDLWWC